MTGAIRRNIHACRYDDIVDASIGEDRLLQHLPNAGAIGDVDRYADRRPHPEIPVPETPIPIP